MRGEARGRAAGDGCSGGRHLATPGACSSRRGVCVVGTRSDMRVSLRRALSDVASDASHIATWRRNDYIVLNNVTASSLCRVQSGHSPNQKNSDPRIGHCTGSNYLDAVGGGSDSREERTSRTKRATAASYTDLSPLHRNSRVAQRPLRRVLVLRTLEHDGDDEEAGNGDKCEHNVRPLGGDTQGGGLGEAEQQDGDPTTHENQEESQAHSDGRQEARCRERRRVASRARVKQDKEEGCKAEAGVDNKQDGKRPHEQATTAHAATTAGQRAVSSCACAELAL